MPRLAPAQSPPQIAVPTVSTPDSPEISEATRQLFREGVAFAEHGQWTDARDRFRRALAVRASPLLRFNLGVAAEHTGNLVEALDQYRQFLRESGDAANATRRREAQTSIATLEPRIAHLTILAPPDEPAASVRLDDRELPQALVGASIPVDPAHHAIDATSARGRTSHATLDLAEGEMRNVTLEWTSPSPTVGTPPSATAAATSPTTRLPPAATTTSPTPAARNRVPLGMDRRRWERTWDFALFQSTGTVGGIAGVNVRWAARPFFEVQVSTGVGAGPSWGFGVGLNLRYPWSYRYAFGIHGGFEFNVLDLVTRVVAPFSLVGAFTHEWRTRVGLTYRLVLGLWGMLAPADVQRDIAARVSFDIVGTIARVFDPMGTVRSTSWPVVPFIRFELGWAL